MHPRLGSSSGLTDVLKVRGSVLARRKPVKRSRWAVLSLLTAAHTLSAAAALAVAPLAPVLLEALMIALAGEAPRFTVLLACLFGAGVGFSVVNPTTGKAIIERFPLRERGLAMGIKQTGLTLGGMLAAFTLPAVALRWGWQAGLTGAGGCAAPRAVGADGRPGPGPRRGAPHRASPAALRRGRGVPAQPLLRRPPAVRLHDGADAVLAARLLRPLRAGPPGLRSGRR